MRWLWLIISLAICGVLVTSALPWLSIRGVRPDLFLIFAMIAVLVGRKERGIMAAWAAGLAKDVFSQGPLGAHAALFLLAALALVYLRPYFSVELISVQALLAAFACLACNALYFLVMFVYHPQAGVVGPIGHVVLAAALTACVMPLAMFAANGWMRFLRIAPAPDAGRH
jgi:rod shape-determining protein MreD